LSVDGCGEAAVDRRQLGEWLLDPGWRAVLTRRLTVSMDSSEFTVSNDAQRSADERARKKSGIAWILPNCERVRPAIPTGGRHPDAFATPGQVTRNIRSDTQQHLCSYFRLFIPPSNVDGKFWMRSSCVATMG
jgi:hypothetical protein